MFRFGAKKLGLLPMFYFIFALFGDYVCCEFQSNISNKLLKPKPLPTRHMFSRAVLRSKSLKASPSLARELSRAFSSRTPIVGGNWKLNAGNGITKDSIGMYVRARF